MSSNADFVQFIADQCSGAGEIAFKRMFGEYGLYCDGTIFGLVCDDCFFLKPTDAVRPLLRTVDLRPPYEGARNYFFVADVDDHAYLSSLVRETCRALRLAPSPCVGRTQRPQDGGTVCHRTPLRGYGTTIPPNRGFRFPVTPAARCTRCFKKPIF